MGFGVRNHIRMKMRGIPVKLTSETIEWEPDSAAGRRPPRGPLESAALIPACIVQVACGFYPEAESRHPRQQAATRPDCPNGRPTQSG